MEVCIKSEINNIFNMSQQKSSRSNNTTNAKAILMADDDIIREKSRRGHTKENA